MSFPPQHEQQPNIPSLCPGRALPPALLCRASPWEAFLWYFGSLVNLILQYGQSFNSMKVTCCFHFYSSTSGQRKTCVSGFKSLIKSFIHGPACWRKVRENKLSHRVLFKLSDPFQHALPASLFMCVWGLGWGGRKRKKKNPDGRKPMEQLAPLQSSFPPAPSPPWWAQASANLFCTHTHAAQHKQLNDFPTTLLTSATLLPVWHRALAPHPRLSRLCLPTSWTGSSG